MNLKNLRSSLRAFILDHTSIPETAMIYEEEKYKIPSSLDYVVKEWIIGIDKDLPTDDSKLYTVTIEYDVIQREDSENDFISSPAWEIIDCLDGFSFEGSLIAKPTLTDSTSHAIKAILIEITFLNQNN